MILALFTLESTKHQKLFSPFLTLTEERYGERLARPMEKAEERSWISVYKPIHAGIAPYMMLDLMVHAHRIPCHMVFANDVLDFSMQREPMNLNHEAIQRILVNSSRNHSRSSSAHFQGFGPRIDLALNAVSTLYMDILLSLTQVESTVLSSLRALQYGKYQDPTETRTFGLQKHVASELNKSPVAIHKSLRSAKYDLLSETAKSMRGMIG